MREYYSISELTQEFDITTRTLRFYEDEGLLKPFRKGRARFYTQADRYRLQQILRAKRLNMSLAEIAALFIVSDEMGQSEEQLRQVLEKIIRRRTELRQMRTDIDISLHELDLLEEDCFSRLAERGVHR